MANPWYFVAPCAAFLAGCLALGPIRRAALAVGFVDNPDRRRKLHEAPIPLGGGLAVWLATWLGWGAGLGAHRALAGEPPGGAGFYAALAAASLAVLLLGIRDDRCGMRGRHKLAGQAAAALILVAAGLRIGAVDVLGVVVDLGPLSPLVTAAWILLVVNAFNLIDGMDGFCGSVGFVAALAIAVLASWSGGPGDAALGLALAGGLAAFLRDNLPPARIYLGDAGSMAVGILVAALSIRACSGGPGGAVSLLPLLALVALPVLDVVVALGRRWLTGRSLFTPDRGHIHHRLQDRLGSRAAALAAAVALALLGAAGATLARVSVLGDQLAGIAMTAAVALLVGTRTFGGSELRLLYFRLRSALAPLLAGLSPGSRAIRHECRLVGARDWASVWDELIRRVEATGVWRVELAIDMPAAGEAYHGLWTLPQPAEDGPSWSVVHTLCADGVQAGVLRVSGSVVASRPRNLHLDEVGALVELLEEYLDAITRPAAAPHPHPDRGIGLLTMPMPKAEHA